MIGILVCERIVTPAGHWDEVGGRLDKAVDTHNKSVATFESHALFSARRLRDLKAGAEDVEIEAIEPIERTACVLQALDLSSIPSNGNER